MARKVIYKQNGLDGQPDAPSGYKYLGYDGDSLSEKTGATVSAIGGGSSALVYKATLTQTGTNNPVATVLENTLGGTIVWTRDGVGEYYATLAGAFPDATKTFALISTWYVNGVTDQMFMYRDDANRFYLETLNAGTNEDGILENVGIVIEVYS